MTPAQFTLQRGDRVRRVVQSGTERRFAYHAGSHLLSQIATPGSVAKTDYAWNARGELATRRHTVAAAPPPKPGRIFYAGFESAATTYTQNEGFTFDRAGRLPVAIYVYHSVIIDGYSPHHK